jgi:hypothetical protein
MVRQICGAVSIHNQEQANDTKTRYVAKNLPQEYANLLGNTPALHKGASNLGCELHTLSPSDADPLSKEWVNRAEIELRRFGPGYKLARERSLRGFRGYSLRRRSGTIFWCRCELRNQLIHLLGFHRLATLWFH